MPGYVVENFLPLYGKSRAEKRMRVHQQWWGWHRLNRSMGQARRGEPFPVLTAAEQRDPATSNFLTAGIHSVAMNTPGLSSDRHFNHLLSSMPMAINLFGMLIDPSSEMRADTPLERIFPGALQTPWEPSRRADSIIGSLMGRPVDVLRVDFEIPGRLRIDAARHPLLDGTSLDVIVEFRDETGVGLIGIETKLTEPLSNGGDLMDPARNYLALFDAPSSPFVGPLSVERCSRLAEDTLVQWTRNQLLAFGFEQSGNYASHLYWTIFPRSHPHALEAANRYAAALKEPQRTFAAFTLEDVLAAWDPLLSSAAEREWLELFRQRYLSLDQSEVLWKMMTGGAHR
jgi:hypothetical protein